VVSPEGGSGDIKLVLLESCRNVFILTGQESVQVHLAFVHCGIDFVTSSGNYWSRCASNKLQKWKLWNFFVSWDSFKPPSMEFLWVKL
jgi:hypothetical protein